MSDAIIVGSGPNGLACAAVLATNGMKVTVLEAADTIGGGTRTSDLTGSGVLHDHCSAVHPMGAASPLFAALGLEERGLKWCLPEVDLAHPIGDGAAGVLHQSIDDTAAGLRSDGPRWKRLLGASASSFDVLNEDLGQPVVHFPRHPLRLARFGIPSLASASLVARGFKTPEAKALFGGTAAHSLSPLTRPMSAAIAMALLSAGHKYGWPVAQGGSRSITDALAAVITENGGAIETGIHVKTLAELPDNDAVILDLAPAGVVEVAGDALPARFKRAYSNYKYGPGAFKIDLAVNGGVPWLNEDCRKAGTVHVVGPFEEMVAAERDINRGKMPERPFVLVAQQYLADPSRSNGDVHPIWAYAHVPLGYDGDATEALLNQIERFAPGLRERIVGQVTRSTEQFTAYNANFIGGDIVTGANTPLQMTVRPRVTFSPYSVGIDGVFICSAATPPGAGVHGMNGYNAARAVLREQDVSIDAVPSR